jgi:hypothetical protein
LEEEDEQDDDDEEELEEELVVARGKAVGDGGSWALERLDSPFMEACA